MNPTNDAVAWSHAMLGIFAGAMQVGELSTGLSVLSNLSESQRIDFIEICSILLSDAMEGYIPTAPARLSTLGGIALPPASELDVRGYVTPARGILVATWNGTAGEHVADLVDRMGTRYSASVVALAAAGMLLTWQSETDQSLENILDACR
jgi:hypothetical protein